MAVMVGVLNEHFMGTDGVHLVINAVAAAAGLTLDVVKRLGMYYRARRPCRAGVVGRPGNFLKASGVGTETAGRIGALSGVTGLVARHDPGTGDGVLAEFHSRSSRRKENTGENLSQPAFRLEIST